MSLDEVHFCLRCGAALQRVQRFGSLRPVCPACDWVYFADPKVAVAALVGHPQQPAAFLFVQRANPPFQGLWTLPAGFVDAGEDPQKAAERECLEETGLVVRAAGLLDVIAGAEHSRGADILIVYRGQVVAGLLQAGDDAAQAQYFSLSALPELAFESTRLILARHAGRLSG